MDIKTWWLARTPRQKFGVAVSAAIAILYFFSPALVALLAISYTLYTAFRK